MKIKNVAMIGRGAVGTIFGKVIQKSLGNEHFHFIVGNDRYEEYKNNKFYCNREECDFHYVNKASDCEPIDLIMISVKYLYLQETMDIIKPFINENTIILSLLNGVVSEDIVEQQIDKGIVIHSIAQKMDAVKEGNKVLYSQLGEVIIGTNDETRLPALKSVETFFTNVHLPYRVANDIIHEQWSKLMLNCGINQICAVYDVPYLECQTGGKYRTMFFDVMKEVLNVAKFQNIFLSEAEMELWGAAVDALSSNSMPSMRQDMLAQRRSEVALFSQTIIQLAKQNNVEVPLNSYLYQKIIEKEAMF